MLSLGMTNCSEILNALGKLSRKKMLRKFIIIGDFNLNGIDWASGCTRSSIEREFLNGFADLGLIQNINVATHNKEKTLDILQSCFIFMRTIARKRLVLFY